jgi:hypothetical protein
MLFLPSVPFNLSDPCRGTGNLLATPNGDLCYLDFGMMSEAPEYARTAIIAHIVHLVNRDYDAMCRDYYTLQFMDPSIDTSPIAPSLAEFFDSVLDKSVSELNFKAIVDGLGAVLFKYPFQACARPLNSVSSPAANKSAVPTTCMRPIRFSMSQAMSAQCVPTLYHDQCPRSPSARDVQGCPETNRALHDGDRGWVSPAKQYQHCICRCRHTMHSFCAVSLSWRGSHSQRTEITSSSQRRTLTWRSACSLTRTQS